jgi:hypothetical protein
VVSVDKAAVFLDLDDRDGGAAGKQEVRRSEGQKRRRSGQAVCLAGLIDSARGECGIQPSNLLIF